MKATSATSFSEGPPDAVALLRAAMELRLSNSVDSTAMLTAALTTVCDDTHAGDYRAEHLVVTIRGAWHDVTKKMNLTDEVTHQWYNAILRQALVIFFAPTD